MQLELTAVVQFFIGLDLGRVAYIWTPTGRDGATHS